VNASTDPFSIRTRFETAVWFRRYLSVRHD